MKKMLASKVAQYILWGLAVIVAVFLTITTINLTKGSASSEDLIGSSVYIAGNEQLSLLRDAPRINAQVTAILERGAIVRITQVDDNGLRVWINVESGQDAGWIEAVHLSDENPEQ